ncbi:hypothetical protein IWQ62_002241 [Dispira parvispora]|uniref:Uncharacterized protein n=1 Tax=Dispira parvispora TaxID=1520584 RepID=A0A9W8AW48_9FUNG|nr:hypothetical protein IWQ62_002241 [Dispira parvispora]
MGGPILKVLGSTLPSHLHSYTTHLSPSEGAARNVTEEDLPEKEPTDSTEVDTWFVDPDFEALPERPLATRQFASPDRGSQVPLWQRRQRAVDAERTAETGALSNVAWADVHPLAHRWTSLTTTQDWLMVCADILSYARAQCMTVIDMRQKCDWTEYMVVAEALSHRQSSALVMDVQKTLKALQRAHGIQPSQRLRLRVEGADCEDWVTLNLGRIIIHILSPEARRTYDLEGLWAPISDPMLAPTRNEGDSVDASVEYARIREIMAKEFKATIQATDDAFQTLTENDVRNSVNMKI